MSASQLIPRSSHVAATARPARLRAAGRTAALAGLLLLVAGPALAQMSVAPSVPAFGAYFPSWLICAALGIVGAIILRAVFIKIGLDDVLPWPLPVYTALAVGVALFASTLLFGS